MEQKNYGSLSTNKFKKQDSHPDFKGSITINGIKYELAGWKKQGDNGAYISLQAQLPRDNQNAVKQPEPQPKNDISDFLNDF